MVFACLSIAERAQAQRVEIGPRLAISVPTGRAGDSADLGFNAGVTATIMNTPRAGLSLDFGYHRWPGSSYANAATDALLSRFGLVPITGSKWTLSAFQTTGQVKVLPPVSGPVAPWIQFGAGVYRVKTNLRLPAPLLSQSLDSITYKFGYTGGVGFDFETSAGMTFGLDASYHYLLWGDNSGVNFTAPLRNPCDG